MVLQLSDSRDEDRKPERGLVIQAVYPVIRGTLDGGGAFSPLIAPGYEAP